MFKSLLVNFNDVDIDVAHQITKKIAGIMFVGLRKIHYNVMTRIMDMNEGSVIPYYQTYGM
jgi:hypothetical protein